MELTINETRMPVEAPPDGILLWVLRDELGLTGTKYGCGEGQCGACTVLLDGQPAHSCQTPLRAVANKKITTIEGIAPIGRLHPLQEAFVEEDAMQCGYCTAGMIMAAVGLLSGTPQPSDEQIVAAMNGHVCRCGTYPRIIAAVRMAAKGNTVQFGLPSPAGYAAPAASSASTEGARPEESAA